MLVCVCSLTLPPSSHVWNPPQDQPVSRTELWTLPSNTSTRSSPMSTQRYVLLLTLSFLLSMDCPFCESECLTRKLYTFCLYVLYIYVLQQLRRYGRLMHASGNQCKPLTVCLWSDLCIQFFVSTIYTLHGVAYHSPPSPLSPLPPSPLPPSPLSPGQEPRDGHLQPPEGHHAAPAQLLPHIRRCHGVQRCH